MLIRSTIQNMGQYPKIKPQSQEKVQVPFKERAVTSAIVGASLGTMAGEQVGEIGFVGGAAYLGYTVGGMFGRPEIGRLVGAAAGAGAGFLVENKLNIGKTVGGAAGFISGGIIGGATGSVIGGVSALLHANPFK